MRLFTKLVKIKFMRFITKANIDSLFLTIYFSINGVQERSTTDNGTKVILWGTKNKKSVGYFIFPHKTSTSLRIPIGDMVSLLASLIVTSMSSISAGAISFLISYKEKGIAPTLEPRSHNP